VPLKRRAAPRAEMMIWDGSVWQKALAESSTNPNLRVRLYSAGTGVDILASQADGQANNLNSLIATAYKYGYNEYSWDRWRNNTEETILASGTRTTSGNSADQTNYNAKGVLLIINVTAVSGTFATGEGLVLKLQAKCPASGVYRILHTPPVALTTTGIRLMAVGLGVTDSDGEAIAANDIPIPKTWRLRYEITGTTPSFTFSVGACYVV